MTRYEQLDQLIRYDYEQRDTLYTDRAAYAEYQALCAERDELRPSRFQHHHFMARACIKELRRPDIHPHLCAGMIERLRHDREQMRAAIRAGRAA